MKRLKEELEKLEAVSGESNEKQKIIDELRKMVMDADVSKKSRLRSGYLALHYDSSSSEIKQLKAELRALKTENDNLKTENLMLKKSDSLKKLAKLKEDLGQNTTEPEKTEETQMLTKSSLKQQYIMQAQIPVRTTARSTERQVFQYQGVQRTFMRASADDVQSAESDNDGKLKQPKTKYTDKDKFNAELEFKFSNIDNESLGQKRSTSKDRGGKRVTFVSDLGKETSTDNIPKVSTGANLISSETETSGNTVTQATTITTVPSIPNGSVKTSLGKSGEKPTLPVTRKKPSHLKTKSTTRRAASLNSLSSSRDIMKMSSQLIQKSRSLRQSTQTKQL